MSTALEQLDEAIDRLTGMHSRRAWLAGAAALALIAGVSLVPSAVGAQQATKAGVITTDAVPFANAEQEAALKAKIRLFSAELKKVDFDSLPDDRKNIVNALRLRALDVIKGKPLYIDDTTQYYDGKDPGTDPRNVYATVPDEYLVLVAKWATNPNDDGTQLVVLNVNNPADLPALRFLIINSTAINNKENVLGAIPSKVISKIADPRLLMQQRMRTSALEGSTLVAKK